MIKSPIKWAGGKTRVMPELLKHLPKADCLIEPFVGSGTVFMNTEYRRYVLCDTNPSLINFFIVLRDNTEQLIASARSLFMRGNGEETYYSERQFFNSLMRDPEESSAVIRAALFLYLNRHCYNGLYRVNAYGEFNVPFGRYKQPYFPEAEMRLFAEKARDTDALFLCDDFRSSIPYIAKNRPDSVIYCAPPPTSLPAKPPISPPTASRLPWTSIALWLQPCSMLIASMAPTRLSQTAIPQRPARSIPLSISMPSAFAALSAPKAATWPVKWLAYFVSAMAVAVLAVVTARTAGQ